MRVTKCAIDGVVIIQPQIHGDHRGYFYESYSHAEFSKEVCRTTFVQDNQAQSSYGVLRGLHFQTPPHAQSKLVRVVQGSVLDVAVDIRRGSPTYGEYVAVQLSEENHCQLFIPRGFAHGYVVLSDKATLLYKCDAPYAPQCEGSLMWNDSDLGIDWGIVRDEIILSQRDMCSGSFADFDSPFDYNVNYYE